MIYRTALLRRYKYILEVIKNRIIEDVLDDYYSSKDTDDIRFNQKIYNKMVENYILKTFSNVDLVVLVDSGLIVSKIETLGKFYSVGGFTKKVVKDIGYEEIKREIDKEIENRAEKGIFKIGKGRFFKKENAVILRNQDYRTIVSKIEKDVILKIADRLDDGEFGISDSLLYSLVNKAVLKNLGDINFVVLTENEVINSDIKIPIIVYSIDKFCDKIVNEIYDSVKSRFKFKNDSEVYKDIEIEEDDYDTSYSMKL